MKSRRLDKSRQVVILVLIALSATLFEASLIVQAQEAPPPPDPVTNDPEQDQDPEKTQTEEQAPEKKVNAPQESGDDVTSQLQESSQGVETNSDQRSGPDEHVTPIEKVVKEEEHESGDNVSGSLRESRDVVVGVWEHGPISEIYRLWKPMKDRLYEDTGIDVGMAYTTLYQRATDGESPREAWSGDVDIFGKWILLNRDVPNTGSTGFLVEQRHRIANITPNDLNENLGALWKTTKAFNVHDAALVQLWWEQYLFDDHVKVVAGTIDPSNFYNGNRFQNQNSFFLNQAFSTNPARAFPDNGLGVNVRIAPSDKFYFSFGAHDTNNSKTTSGFNNLDKDELFYAWEIGLTPRFEGQGAGRYRFTAWYTGAGQATNGESGSGFALSFEQDLGNDLVPFLRYGYQDDQLKATKQVVVGGLGVLNPFGRPHDLFGAGFAWGEPHDSSFRDQYVAELFYRYQLTPKIQLTPGFQMIFDPSKNPDDDFIGVFEFRVRVVF
ncbi:MAG: carbohydrate porin [Planctomycetota bacterium]|nr:carbohydrate porin [Planctomycetota bacterium]